MSKISELIVDAYGCTGPLSEPIAMEKAARRALELVGATVVETASYRFQPHGLTLVLILKESHFIVSTWPEHEMAIVNIFLCNEAMDAKEVWKQFSTLILPSQTTFHLVKHTVKKLGSDKKLVAKKTA